MKVFLRPRIKYWIETRTQRHRIKSCFKIALREWNVQKCHFQICLYYRPHAHEHTCAPRTTWANSIIKCMICKPSADSQPLGLWAKFKKAVQQTNNETYFISLQRRIPSHFFKRKWIFAVFDETADWIINAMSWTLFSFLFLFFSSRKV